MSIIISCLLSLSLSLATSNKIYIYVGPQTRGDGGLRLGREDAEKYCEDHYNGYLATIESDEENSRVANLCQDFGQLQGGCLIGLNNEISLPSTWTNGKPLTYTNWDISENEPDKTGDQPYVIIRSDVYVDDNGIASGSLWSTTRPVNFPFVCEQDGLQYIHIKRLSRNYVIYGEQLLTGGGNPPHPILPNNQALVSNDRRFVAAMQPEGNLVVYDTDDNDTAIWYTDQKIAASNQYLILQNTDGNLVIYGDTGYRWNAKIGNYIPSHLIMQNDGMYIF